MLTPSLSAYVVSLNKTSEDENFTEQLQNLFKDVETFPAMRHDTNYYPKENVLLAGEQNDIGYNVDVGDNKQRALPVYVGEPIDETVPGRGRTAELDGSRDKGDMFSFTVCEGQTITASVTSGFNIQILNPSDEFVGTSYTADVTGKYYVKIDDGVGNYTFSVTLSGQNDAGTGGDAGNDINSATPITPGKYIKYIPYPVVSGFMSGIGLIRLNLRKKVLR